MLRQKLAHRRFFVLRGRIATIVRTTGKTKRTAYRWRDVAPISGPLPLAITTPRRCSILVIQRAHVTELVVTCFPVSGLIFAGKFQFSGCVIRAAGR
jgi:hypothetical protein